MQQDTPTQLALITGASSGIGQALAARYYAAGYCLALIARRTSETKSWATQHGMDTDRFQVYSGDVAIVDSIVAACQAHGIECVLTRADHPTGSDRLARRGRRQCGHQLRRGHCCAH